MNSVEANLVDTTARGADAPTVALPVAAAAGIEAWHVESPVVPMIALAFTFEGGAAQDPEGKGGVAQMLARLLDEGAGDLSSDAFQERLAARAIELSFHAGADAVGGSLKMLVKHADEAIDLLALALAKPRFDADAIERVRAQTLAGLRYQQNDPGVMASRRFFAEAYAGHPYARPSSGTPESIAAITRDDLVAMHRQLIGRGGLKVAAVGAIDSDRLADALNRAFGVLNEAGPLNAVPQTQVGPARSPRRRRYRRAAIGPALRHGRRAVEGSGLHPRLCAQPYSGRRLFHFTPCSRKCARSGDWPIPWAPPSSATAPSAMTWGYTATKNGARREALSVIGDEIGRLISDVRPTRSYRRPKIISPAPMRSASTPSTKIAHQLVQISFEGLGMDYFARRNEMVTNVTQADIRRAGAPTFADGRMLVVAAGRPTDFL